MHRYIAAIFLTAFLVVSPVTAEDAFFLTRDGQPVAEIVTAPDIEQPFEDGVRNPAVRDFIRIVARMSGAALPVVVEENSLVSEVPQIHLGMTEFVRENGLIPASLPPNGFRIVTTEENGVPRLVIAGPSPLGTSHGIYDLLERELGVVWGMAPDLFEEIPENATVEVGPVDRAEQPDFAARTFAGDETDWPRRMRLDQRDGRLLYVRQGHNVSNIITLKEFPDHPEYWAYYDGRWRQPESWPHPRSMICMTNSDVIQITIDKVRTYFDEHPAELGYSLCGADNDTWCECPSCAALDKGLEPINGQKQYSDSYFTWVDTVAKALMQTHPDRYLSAYGYLTTEMVPRRDTPLPPNVVVYLTQDGTQHFDPDYAARDDSMMEAWSKIVSNIALYEYGNLGWFAPRNLPHLTAERISKLPARGVKAIYNETFPNWPNMGPFIYVLAHACWYADTDADSLLATWYSAMFHEAAPQMQAFYETLEDAWMHADRHGYWMAGRARLWENFAAWPPEYRERAWQQLEDAYGAAESDVVKRRIEFIMAGHRVAYDMDAAFEAIHTLTPRSSEADIRTTIALFDDAMASYHANIEGDRWYHDTYYRGHRIHELFKWFKQDLWSGVERATADRPELQTRLLHESPTLAEAYNIAKNRRMAGYMRWVNKGIEQRGLWPKWAEQ